MKAYNDITLQEPEVVIISGASLTGYGSTCNGVTTAGRWVPEEARFHFNYLELKAALFALQSFQKSLGGKHVRIMMDNTTAIACVSHMGTSHSDACNDITCKIWEWCSDRDIHLSAAHIPGRYNTGQTTVNRSEVNL